MSDVEDIINGLLRLQDKILGDKPVDRWVKDRVVENIGNVASLRVFDEEGETVVTLKLDRDLRIRKTNEKPKHVITMHIDTFIDLLTGDLDFRQAYVNGLVDFEGENYHVHAMMWARAFERIRGWLIKRKLI